MCSAAASRGCPHACCLGKGPLSWVVRFERSRALGYNPRVTLRPCSDLSAAGWITSSDLRWEQLVTFGPSGFPAYARLRLLPDPEHPGQAENDAHIEDDRASESAQLGAVLQMLSRHTRTPDDCYFCLWDGWGSGIYGGDGMREVDLQTGTTHAGPQMTPAFPPTVLHGPKVVVPNRAYFLFHGKISELGEWGAAEMWPGQPRSDMPDPAFIWPADHAWCIAHDVDPHWIGIGAGKEAIEELIAHPLLDVVPADPREDQPHYQ
jgi:hypothetical protein